MTAELPSCFGQTGRVYFNQTYWYQINHVWRDLAQFDFGVGALHLIHGIMVGVDWDVFESFWLHYAYCRVSLSDSAFYLFRAIAMHESE